MAKLSKSQWLTQAAGLIALAALAWLLGPALEFAGAAPLEQPLPRALAIAAIFLAWLAWHFFMALQAIRKDQSLMDALAAVEAPAHSHHTFLAAQEEKEILQNSFEQALAALERLRGEGNNGQPFLHQMPWYVILGAPGSGKTTALLNSGLKFPLQERLGHHAVHGVGGTRNCDWFFTDRAVLLDTAGRYATQDSHQAVDAAAWQNFLQLLKKHRAGHPLNGILLTVSVGDLLTMSESELNLHAQAMRQRINELYATLGANLPVYLLLTKTDLMAGFTEFFADLTPEMRMQVWGETFALDARAPADQLKAFEGACEELLGRLQRRAFKRIQEERELQKRGLILDFPQQIALLKPALLSFLQDVFLADGLGKKIALRGVYFTSGTQEGTPIDRIMGVLASAFRLDRQTIPLFSGQGKSFFITQLLNGVIFAEAELAGVDLRQARRWHIIQYGAYGCALLVFLALLTLWGISYARNQAAIRAVETQIARYHAVDIKPIDSRSNFTALAPKLDALLRAREVFQNADWLMGLGLSQQEKLQQAANSAYARLLRGAFLQAIRLRLRERIAGEEAANTEVLQQLQQLDRMLAQADKLDAKQVRAWISLDWQQVFATEADILASLNTHLGHLLELRLAPSPLDQVSSRFDARQPAAYPHPSRQKLHDLS
jgi:type VI secretion system protein ImpL